MAAGDNYRANLAYEKIGDDLQAAGFQTYGGSQGRIRYFDPGNPGGQPTAGWMEIEPFEVGGFGNAVRQEDGKYYVPADVWSSVLKADYEQRHGGEFSNILGNIATNAPVIMGAAGAAGAAGGFFDPYSLSAGAGSGSGAATGGLLSGGAGDTSLLGGAAGDTLGAGSSLYGPTAAELGVPGATGYAAPGLEWVGGGALMGPSAAELGVPGATGYSAPAAASSLIPGVPNNVASGVGQGLLGVAGATQQANAIGDVADQQYQLGQDYLGIGAPYRDTLAQSYQPGFDLMSQPGYGDAFQRASDIATRSWASRAGNPAENPTAQAGILNDVWSQNYLPALSNYRGQLGQFGGLGLNQSGGMFGNSAQTNLAGAQAQGGAWDALGYGIGTALNPKPTLDDYFGTMAKYGLNIGGNSYGR